MDKSLLNDISRLDNVEGFFNPFSLINGESSGFIGSITNKFLVIALSLASLILIFRLIQNRIKTVDSEKPEELYSILIDAIIVVVLLASYKLIVPIFPSFLNSIGQRILEFCASDVKYQMADVLESIGSEKSTEFKYLTASLRDMNGTGLLSALFSCFALICVWVISFVQPYLFTMWYVMGPILIPFYLFDGTQKYFKNWALSILSVSLWSPIGAILLTMLAKTHLLKDAYLSGLTGHFFSSIAMSLVIIFCIFLIPTFASNIMNGVSASLTAGLMAASKGTKGSIGGANKLGGLAKASGKFSKAVGNKLSNLPVVGKPLGTALNLSGSSLNSAGNLMQSGQISKSISGKN